jgi:hypothetical protein
MHQGVRLNKASATNWAVMLALIDQPPARRENRSIAADTWALGGPEVGKSAIHFWFAARPQTADREGRLHARYLAIAFVLRQTPAPWMRPQGLQAHQPLVSMQPAFDATRQRGLAGRAMGDERTTVRSRR